MRVLHIYKDYAPVVGGIENNLRLLAEGQRAMGMDVQVLVTSTGRRTQRMVINDVPVTKAGRLLNVSSAPISPAFFPLLRRMEKGIDITHAHLPYPPGELAHLLLGRSKRLVLTYHSDIVRQKTLERIYRPFLWRVLRQAALISVSSEAYMRSSPFLSAYAEKCRVIPFGIELEQFAPTPEIEAEAAAWREHYGPRPLILFVGRLRHYKGVDVLIDAMRRVDAHLLILGSGMMETTWRAQANEAGLLDRITFLGDRSDQEKLAALHGADLFVLPSTNRAEAFGIVLLEALACGLPLVTTELGTGTSVVNQHGVTGLVAPPQDPDALADAINRILGDDEMRRRMGEAARRRAQTVYSKEVMLQQMHDFYMEAMQVGALAQAP